MSFPILFLEHSHRLRSRQELDRVVVEFRQELERVLVEFQQELDRVSVRSRQGLGRVSAKAIPSLLDFIDYSVLSLIVESAILTADLTSSTQGRFL